MIFRFSSLDSAFASVAIATTSALVATRAIATNSDEAFAGLTPASSESNINRVYVPKKISDRQDKYLDVNKEGGIESSLRIETSIKERTISRTTRQLRNSSKGYADNGNDHSNGDDTIDLGILVNALPTDTKGERRRELAVDDYCYKLCGSNRMVIPSNSNIKSLVNYCESSGNCGDCYGDGDNIDYRCPSQIKCWNTSEVTSMRNAFEETDFNEPLRCWDVSSVTEMLRMFSSAKSFNQPIDNWNVSSVTDMREMFFRAKAFNQPLQSWDVSSVTTIRMLFQEAKSFNQPLDLWDVSGLAAVDGMAWAFTNAANFNQCLSTWDAKLQIYVLGSDIKGTACPVQPGGWSRYYLNAFCQGPNQQCFPASCEDDPTFLFEDEELQDCEWVASEETAERCAKEGVPEACSKTCNPACFGGCYDDPDFQLNGIKAKTCEWVAKQKTSERCKKPGVIDACRQTCNPVCPAAAVDCTNDQDFRLNGIKAKTCEWVAKQKTNERCKKPGVMNACSQTCNPSCGCTDTTEEFEFQGGMITCEDLDTNYCDAELVSSGDEFLEQIQNMLDEALIPIHEKLVALGDVEDDAEEELSADSVLDRKTYGDLCANKCRKCIDSS
jgi:surface protein